jgi:DeoR family ulaG and ulaABCDEF operon transcriptional repressor
MSHSPTNLRRIVSPVIEVATGTRMHGNPTTAMEPHRTPVCADWMPPGPGPTGTPLDEHGPPNRRQKEWIGREAARLCSSKEAVMIDGGSTTRQMCAHLAGLNLQVLTNSLLIVNALLPQKGTRVLLPGGQVFAEQNIILSAAVDDDMPRFHAPTQFQRFTRCSRVTGVTWMFSGGSSGSSMLMTSSM